MTTKQCEDASFHYAGVESHEGLPHYSLIDTVASRDEKQFSQGG